MTKPQITYFCSILLLVSLPACGSGAPESADEAEFAADGGLDVASAKKPLSAAPDLTSSGTPIALITQPTGGGNHSISVIKDGVYPATGSTSSSQQYDTYTGTTRTDDWIGYQFASPQTFGSLLFQGGVQFSNGGWFTSVQVQIRQGGTWVNVPNTTVTPAYAGHDGIHFEQYTFSFPAITGDGIRLDGRPGGTSTFVSVGELRAFGVGSANGSPTASAGSNQAVPVGSQVTLDGSGSRDPEGAALTYAWTQTAGPTVTLSSRAAQKPTFSAPSVTASTNLTFSLVVNDGTLASAAATVTVTVSPAASSVDLTASGSILASVTNPTGSGSRNLEVIRDGVYPAQGSTDGTRQFDTYNGAVQSEAWFGYQFGAAQSFGSVVFQGGKQFPNGGWFASIKVQVKQNGTWVSVPQVTVTPAYAGHDGINFETYTFRFPSITGDGIRIDGVPGGSSTFVSVAELRVFSGASTAGAPPAANAGPSQSVAVTSTVTLDGSGSYDPGGAPVTYTWTQTGGPAVTLSSSTAQKPTFFAPATTASITLSFALVVRNATTASGAATTTVEVHPALPGSAGCGKAVTQTGSLIGPSIATFLIGGRQRTFRYEVPYGYSASEPIPLTFGFHGAGGSGAQAQGWGIHTAAAQNGQRGFFIYPDGVDQGGGTGWDENSGSNDVKFFDALLGWASSNFCIDAKRVFVAGFSWGTDFANALGCFRGDKIRAINGFSGVFVSSGCTAQTPAYRTTYSSGTNANGTTNPQSSTDWPGYDWSHISSTLTHYQTAQSCGTLTQALANPVLPGPPCYSYTNCAKPVIFCPYPNMGHQVPANGAAEAWTFFNGFK